MHCPLAHYGTRVLRHYIALLQLEHINDRRSRGNVVKNPTEKPYVTCRLKKKGREREGGREGVRGSEREREACEVLYEVRVAPV